MRRKLVHAFAIAAIGVMLVAAPASAHWRDTGRLNPWERLACRKDPTISYCPTP